MENIETKINFCDLCQPGYMMDSTGTCVQSAAKNIVGCFTTKYDND